MVEEQISLHQCEFARRCGLVVVNRDVRRADYLYVEMFTADSGYQLLNVVSRGKDIA